MDKLHGTTHSQRQPHTANRQREDSNIPPTTKLTPTARGQRNSKCTVACSQQQQQKWKTVKTRQQAAVGGFLFLWHIVMERGDFRLDARSINTYQQAPGRCKVQRTHNRIHKRGRNNFMVQPSIGLYLLNYHYRSQRRPSISRPCANTSSSPESTSRANLIQSTLRS